MVAGGSMTKRFADNRVYMMNMKHAQPVVTERSIYSS